jgi:hypothetical protein
MVTLPALMAATLMSLFDTRKMRPLSLASFPLANTRQPV